MALERSTRRFVTAATSSGVRILLVEDEPANRALVRAIVARAARPELGNPVLHEATTLGEARQLLARHAVDIVLLDVRLPDGNGLALAREIKTAADSARVVIVSASVLPAEQANALASGAAAFLPKPIDASILVDMLVRLAPRADPDHGSVVGHG